MTAADGPAVQRRRSIWAHWAQTFEAAHADFVASEDDDCSWCYSRCMRKPRASAPDLVVVASPPPEVVGRLTVADSRSHSQPRRQVGTRG